MQGYIETMQRFPIVKSGFSNIISDMTDEIASSICGALPGETESMTQNEFREFISFVVVLYIRMHLRTDTLSKKADTTGEDTGSLPKEVDTLDVITRDFFEQIGENHDTYALTNNPFIEKIEDKHPDLLLKDISEIIQKLFMNISQNTMDNFFAGSTGAMNQFLLGNAEKRNT